MDDNDEPPTLLEKISDKKVPLTIISGFLGAGKSTLLKRILTERHGYRIAVIMNEFGDTAVSFSLISVFFTQLNLILHAGHRMYAKTINVSSSSAEQTEEFLELANGCLCCSIKDSGIAAIENLMRKKGAFDYILLETTGLADPGPIASSFWQNEEYATGLADIVLDGVVCVVDGVFGRQQMQEDHAQDDLEIGESLRQIAASDVILLNKVDMADPSIIQETQALIHNINPIAPIHHTIKGEIDLKHIIGISAYKNPRLPPPTNAPIRATVHDPENHVHTSHCQHDEETKPATTATTTHYERRGISSIQVDCPTVLSQTQFDAFDKWLRDALWENQVDDVCRVQILRCKGAFRDERSGRWFVLQGVRNVYEISELMIGSEGVDIPDKGKIVLIGKGLNEKVKESLENIFLL